MDWLQFIAAVIGHLAWPTVIVVLFVILRKHMGALADRLLEFSFGGAKITFDKILMRGAEIIEHAPKEKAPELTEEPQLKLEPPAEIPPQLPQGEQNSTDQATPDELPPVPLGIRRPEAEIFSSYDIVNHAIQLIGAKLGFRPGGAVDEKMILFSLTVKGLITKEMYDLYAELAGARNLLARTKISPTWTETAEYSRQAMFLHKALTALRQKIDRGEVNISMNFVEDSGF
jgi:hypothetical protein